MAANRKDPDRRMALRRGILLAVAAGFVLVVALISYFVPFRSMLPALRIPARGAGEARVHFIDVGQGDCTVIEFPEGDCLVVDAGDGSFEHDQRLLRYLKGLGSPKLTLVATHPDADHCGGMAELMDRFDVEMLYLPYNTSDSRYFTRMLSSAERNGVPTASLTRYGAIVRPSGAYAVCLSPNSIEETDDNDSSIVLYFSYGGTNLLLGADISAVRERKLMRDYALDETIFDRGELRVRLSEVDILRVSHHGSDGSSSEEWLSLLGAEAAIISSGCENPYGHPGMGAVERLTEYVDELYRIDELGDIVVTVSQENYVIQTRSSLS